MPRGAKRAFIAAGAGILLLVATWYATFHVGLVKHADQSIFQGFAGLDYRPRVDSVANFIARLCDPQPYVYFAWAPAAVALATGRPRIAVAVGAIVVGANVTTQLLKPLLAEPRAAWLLGGVTPVGPASWPSGHATAAMSLALASVLAVPRRARPIAATAGAAFAVVVSYSFLTLGWHYPSDVFGGFLVAASWTLLAVGAVFTLDAHRPRREPGSSQGAPSLREALAPAAGALLAALLLAGTLALARPHEVVSYMRAHEAFMVGAATIGLLALALATGVMLVARR